MKSLAKFSVDSGWSWVVCFASFLVQFVALGVPNSFGTFFVAFLQEFKEGESKTAWVGSITLAFVFFCGPFVFQLIKRLGPRGVVCLGSGLGSLSVLLTSFVQDLSLAFITYGLLMGVACSLCYFGSLSGIVLYFERHLSIALGICIAGSGVGTPVFITVLDFLNRHYGWRMTFRGLTLVFGVVCLCGLTYIPRKSSDLPYKATAEKQNSKEEIQSTILVVMATKSTENWKQKIKRLLEKLKQVFCLFFDSSVLKNKAFVVWTVGIALAHFGYFMPFVFLIRIAENIGVGESQSALLIAYMAILQVVGKIIFGKIGDIPAVNPVGFLQAGLFIQGVATTLLPLATKYWALVLYVIVFGLCDGCFSIMLAMGTCRTVGQNKMTAAIGHLYGVVSIPSVLGPPFAGLLYDKLGTYNVAFYLAGALSTLGVSLIFLVFWLTPPSTEEVKEENMESLIEIEPTSEEKSYGSCEGEMIFPKITKNQLGLKQAISFEEMLHFQEEHSGYNKSRPSSFIFLNMCIDSVRQQCYTETTITNKCEAPIFDKECALQINTSGNLKPFPSGSVSLIVPQQNIIAPPNEKVITSRKMEILSIEAMNYDEDINMKCKHAQEQISANKNDNHSNRGPLGEVSKDDAELRKTHSTSLESSSSTSSITKSLRSSHASLSSESDGNDSGFGEDIATYRGTEIKSSGTSSCQSKPVTLFSELLHEGQTSLDLYSQQMENTLEEEAKCEKDFANFAVLPKEPIGSRYAFSSNSSLHKLRLSRTKQHFSKSPETIV